MRHHFLLIVCLNSLCCTATFPQELVVVDQVGYRPGDPKIGFMREPIGTGFEVRNVETNKPAFSGTLARIGRRDPATGDDVYQLDFTSLNTPGVYRIWIPGSSVTSTEFRIAPDVYNQVLLRTLESFYYHRCGTAIENGTPWTHPACHLRDASFYDNPSATRNVAGGWHDAGDYNKFVATTALSAAFVLYTYDFHPHKFLDGQLRIPEASNGIPDILDEARCALQWLLTMQQDDGGIFHKVSIKQWTNEHLPHEEKDTQYIFRVSSTATASVAAVAALGSRMFRDWDAPFALALMRCAVRAWDFLEAHATVVPPGGFKNPPDVSGGEYGDVIDIDERLWAAVELYRLTGNVKYHDYFIAHHRKVNALSLPPSWMNVGNLAFYSYVNAKNTNTTVRASIVARITSYGNRLVERVNAGGYRCVLHPDEFYWGSNSVALGYAFDLINAHVVTHDPGFLHAALDQVHYILGRNTFTTSFVTGIGTHPVSHPYHQFSMLFRSGNPVPGMVAGGPNRHSKLKGKEISPFPGKCYEDNEKNYFVNETAINYTAPLVFVAGFVSSGTVSAAAKGSRSYAGE